MSDLRVEKKVIKGLYEMAKDVVYIKQAVDDLAVLVIMEKMRGLR